MQKKTNTAWPLWRTPLALNTLLGVGLACALLGEGAAWRALAWLCLLLPAGVIGWYARKPS
jgi:hypothetical protein